MLSFRGLIRQSPFFFSLLQTWGICLAFGGLWLVWRSKRAQLFSRLEGLSYFSAPNVGNLSRVWSVRATLSLQTWGIYLAFGVFELLYRSKRAQLFRRLWSFLHWLTTFAVFFICITYINNAGRSTLGILCITVIVCIPNL